MASLKHPMLLGTALALTCLIPAHVFAQDADVAPAEPEIDEARLMLDRWVETRRTISKQKSDWALGKQMLVDRIDLLQRNISEVEQEIASQKQKLEGFDESVASLEAKNEALKKAADELAELVDEMEARAVSLLNAAPQPLIESVKPLAVQIPGYGSKQDQEEQAADAEGESDPATSEEADQAKQEEKEKAGPPLSRRVENVVGALYLFNRYTGKIDQTSELVSRPDGTSLSVDAVYLGTSYGFYVDDEDKLAASGWSAPTGWAWQEADASAASVRQVIQVFNKDQTAAFVGLPVEVK